MDVERLLDPEIRQKVQTTDLAQLRANFFPDSDASAWAAKRRATRAVQAAARPTRPPVGLTVEEHEIPGPTGAPALRLRVYTPAASGLSSWRGSGSGLRPALLWIYGGAFAFGTLDEWEEQYRQIAKDFDAVVIGVDYRKAPDDPFPAAVEDCYAALCWMSENAEPLSIDAKRIVVGGQSAGGTFTAALTLMARDRGGPRIAFQLPLVAALDDRLATHSSRSITDERIVHFTQYDRAWKHYLGSQRNGNVSPYAAPARAMDLSGLPPAYMFVGALDPMCDENMEYAMRLKQAGVPTEFHLYPGAPHGFTALAPSAAVSKRAQDDFAEALKRALRP